MASLQAVLVVAEVAESRDFVQVAFKLDHRRWRSIFDDELDSGERFEHTTPLHGGCLDLIVKEIRDSLDVRTDETEFTGETNRTI